MAQDQLVTREDDGFALRVDDTGRDLLRQMLEELRALLIVESPASDPSVARLFPPAYPDDLLQNLDFERTAGSGLLAERLADVDKAAAALEIPRLSEESVMALMRSVNDLRLVYGTRLDVTEHSERHDFTQDPDRQSFDLYVWLGWLIQDALDALGEDG